jgi:hypothetical protein
MFLLHQVNFGPYKILRSECVQKRQKFESIVETTKRANLLVWIERVIAYMKYHLFPVFFFQERETNCRLGFFFFFFVMFASGVSQLLRLIATTCFQALLKLLVLIEDKHERPQ